MDQPLIEAEFVSRDQCISCGSNALTELSSGQFSDEPLASFIRDGIWGENPYPYLKNARWRFVNCAHCEQAFHQNILAPSWNLRRFEQWMTDASLEIFERPYRAPEKQFLRAIDHVQHVLRLERLTRPIRDDTTPLKLLDFGCGNGEFLECCRGFGFDVTGVDRSSSRRKNNKVPILSDVSQIEGQFHAITLFEVLEHLDDPLSILKFLRAHATPGSILVLETPDCSGVKTIKTKADYDLIHPLDHINAFTPKTMETIAARTGFQRINKPAAFATTQAIRIAKSIAAYWLKRNNTRQYFVAV